MNRYLILAADPDDGEWSIVLQTADKVEALTFWDEQPPDPSHRILVATEDFITFEVEQVKGDGDE